MNKQGGSRNWWRLVVGVPVAIVVVSGVVWSGLWWWAAGTGERTMAAWRDREARAGRVYDCATTSFSGFPLRLTVTCGGPSVDEKGAGVSMRAKSLSAVSEVFEPTVVSGEIDAPVTMGPFGGAPAASLGFGKAHASLHAMPGGERVTVAVEQPVLTAVPAGTTLATAEGTEMQSRFNTDGADGHPVLELELDTHGVKVPGAARELGRLGPLAADGTDMSVAAQLHGLSRMTLKPLSQQLREIQAAGGRLEITRARMQQGELIVAATGTLTLTERGTLDGDLQLTVVDLSRLFALLDLERMLPREVREVNRFVPALDRLLPGLGGAMRGAEAQGIAEAGISALGGKSIEFEGKKAYVMPLHFADGAAHLGRIKVGEVPPLF